MKKQWVKPLVNELAVSMTAAVYKQIGSNDGTFIVGIPQGGCTPIGYVSNCNCG